MLETMPTNATSGGNTKVSTHFVVIYPPLTRDSPYNDQPNRHCPAQGLSHASLIRVQTKVGPYDVGRSHVRVFFGHAEG